MSRLHGSKDFWIGALRAEGAAFRAAVAEAPPDTPVLSCPEWTVADLVRHLGARLRLGRALVGRAAPSAPARRRRPATRADRRRPVELVAATSTTGSIDAARRARPGGCRPGTGRRSQDGGVLAAPDGARDGGPPLGRPDGDRGRPSRSRRSSPPTGSTEVLDTWLPAGRRRADGEWHGHGRSSSPPTPARSGTSGCAARASPCWTPTRSSTTDAHPRGRTRDRHRQRPAAGPLRPGRLRRAGGPAATRHLIDGLRVG